MSGLIAFTYIVLAICTGVCVVSALFCAQTVKENTVLKRVVIQLRRAVRQLRDAYARLYAWVLGQGLQPPTPEPSQVEQAERE